MTICIAIIILLAVAVWQWRRMGEKIEPPEVVIMEEEREPIALPPAPPKPAPTIASYSHTEPIRGKRKKTRKQRKERRVWDEV